MAVEMKCDICGKSFKKTDNRDYICIIGKKAGEGCNYYYDKALCFKCTEEFEDWFRNKKIKKLLTKSK